MSIPNSSSNSAFNLIPNTEENNIFSDKRFLKYKNAIIPGKSINGIPTTFLSKGMYNVYFNNNKKLKHQTICTTQEKPMSFDLGEHKQENNKMKDSFKTYENSIKNSPTKKTKVTEFYSSHGNNNLNQYEHIKSFGGNNTTTNFFNLF